MMKKLPKKMVKEYQDSPSIVYFLLENKAFTLGAVAILAFMLRFLLALQGDEMLEALGKGLEFSSIVSASLIAVLLYFKDAVNMQIVKRISESEHTTVFGLGEFSIALLNSEVLNKSNSYIIFEKNVQNDKVEYFRKAGMGVVKGDAFDREHLERLNFQTMSYAIIALGNDRLNMELASIIIDYYKDKKIDTPIKLAVHIINQDLNALFHQEFVSTEDAKKYPIDIHTFSFYEEAAESFFEQNFVDGESNEIINSSEEYHIVVAGNGELALNIIFQAAKIAHLPNENRLIVHIVDKEAQKLKKQLVKRYTGIEEAISIETLDIDDETIEYFKDELWFIKNLTHVIVCYDDEERNLKIFIDLFNKTYLQSAADNALKTRINFAIFNDYNMSNKIDKNHELFKHCFSFADVKTICTRENLLDEKNDLISKLVHQNYAEKYAPNELYDLQNGVDIEKILHKWYHQSKLSDKLSSMAQAKHIPMKLKALGLKSIKSDKAPKELLENNRRLLDAALKDDRDALRLDDAFLQDYSKELPKLWGDETSKKSINIHYFPKEYKTMFEKLLRAEHNRWNAFHYSNGWTYNEVKSKPKKEHDCLMPLAEFQKAELQLTVIYDIYAILYIPNYLANAGYEIKERE